uniref:ORF n=1 Tax=Chaq-like virus TaxID=2759331 RepID=A0A7D6WTZ8_9VIRU|nr:ORF [Chaq-like virus]QMI58127.1 ORF [Chaq-like virus]
MRRVFRGNATGNNNNRAKGNKVSVNGSSKLTGNKFVPSDDPPVLSGQPWNTIVIDTSLSIPTGNWSYFKISDLYKCLQNQCGFNSGSGIFFECRLLSVSLWAAEKSQSVSTMTYTRLCVMVMDVVHDNSTELIRLESNAMRNKFAKAGYHYPITISSVPLKIDTNISTILVSAQASTQCEGILHLKVLWRGGAAGFKAGLFVERWVPFPRVRVSEADEAEDFSDLVDDVESNN